MSEYARVAIFEVDDDALDAIITQINATDAPPDGVPGTRITVLADRAGGKVAISVRFASEEDMSQGLCGARLDGPAREREHAARVGRQVRGRDRQAAFVGSLGRYRPRPVAVHQLDARAHAHLAVDAGEVRLDGL